MYGWILAGVLTAGVTGVGYFYFDYTQDKMTRLNKEVTALKGAVVVLRNAQEESEETIKQMTEDRDATAAAMAEYARRARIAEEYQDDLLRVLHDHDLTELVSKKPGLTGKVINDGIDEVFSDFESISSVD